MIKFTIKEFLIEQESTFIPVDIADKILKYHIAIMMPIREEIGCAIWPSYHSGYRPKTWEQSKNRNGKSEHCFEGKGAVDWTCRNKWQLELLFEELKKTNYTRVCYYPNHSFIHCDYKGDEKISFTCKNGEDWIRE